MMLNERPDRGLDSVAPYIQLGRGPGRLRCIGTGVLLLVWEKLGINLKTVLQVVNAEFGCLAKADRAEVTGDLQTARVGGVNRGFQFGPMDVHVGLKRPRTLADPILYRATGVVGICKHVHLRGKSALSLQIRSGHIDLGADEFSVVDSSLQFKIKIRLETACGADRGHSGRQIEARKTERHVVEDSAARGIEEVIVHADQPRQSGVAGEVQVLGSRRDFDRSRGADGRDFVPGNNDRLVGPGGGTSAVDDSQMLERDDARGHTNEVLNRLRPRLRKAETTTTEE